MRTIITKRTDWRAMDDDKIVLTTDAYTVEYCYEDNVYEPCCPKCETLMTYCQATVDQDEMGNDIDAEWWSCYACKLSTQMEYLD